MTGEIAAALTSLKVASEIAKALKGVRDLSLVQSKVIELQGEILSAQSSAFAAQEAQASLLKRIGQLEQEVTDFKAWDAEKQRYQLTELRPGAFAYSLKPDAGGSEPPHCLCANCYAQGHKAILQEEKVQSGWAWVLRCNRCKAEVGIPRKEPLPGPIILRRG
jgi:hypothetical protein